MKARITLIAFLVALLALFAIVAGLSPLLADDWDHVVWATEHRHDASWWSSFIQTHQTFSSVTTYVLARSTAFHVVVTPLVSVALVWGVFVFAMRRRPRFDDWTDVTGFVLIAALIWIAAPRAGLVYFHRPYAGVWLYGTTLAIWFLAPMRCGLQLRRWQIVLVVLAGFLVGTATRQLGIVAALGTLYAIKRREQRPLWLYLALVAVIVGFVIGFRDRPFDYRGFRPGVELSMVALNIAIFECGELISLVGGLVLVKIVIGKLWPRYAGDGSPDTTETLRWLWAWFGYCVLALFGPRYSEATLFVASVILVIAAYPYVRWVMTSVPMKYVVLAIAVAINVIAWSMALSTYVPLHAKYEDRVAKLRATPRGGVGVVDTYEQIRPSFFAYGEDWGEAARRQLVATEIFRLRDIELVPPFRRLETNPKLTLTLEVEGVTPEQLRLAGAPEEWAGTLRTARVQFATVIGNLRRTIKTPFAARLVVPKSYALLAGRPLLAASYDAGTLTSLRIQRRQADEESRIPVQVTPKSFVAKHPEAYAVAGDRYWPIKYVRGRAYLVQALTTELHAVVACDPQRCFLVEAFIPAF